LEKKRGKLFVFAAPSGSGKTTIVKSVLNKYPGFIFSISATTRKKRECEIDGKDYYFLTEEDFKDKIEKDEFVEWECFYDYYYGTLKSFIDKNLENGHSVLFDVDVKGAVSIKHKYPDAVLFFVLPPSFDELKKRLINRNTENNEDLKKRIERAEMEMDFASKKEFDYKVVNDDLEKAKILIEEIIEKEINKE
jgi:guanylate kinase